MKEAIRMNFDESAEAYEAYERQTGRFGDIAEGLGEAIKEHGGRIQTVLDAGAGTGASTRRLDLDRVIALDISTAMLAENPANERVQADFDHLPFADKTFNAVVFTASLFLSPSPDRSVAEAARVLGEDGIVGAVAPVGWRDGNGEDVFADLERDSRSPSGVEEVTEALEAMFDVESGVWSFSTTPADLRSFHAIPAMAARLYPRLDVEERLERVEALLVDVRGPLEQRWRWFVGY